MREAHLNEMQDWRGRWWLPGSPGEAHAGFLTYDPDGSLELVLVGGFDATIRKQVGPNSWSISGDLKDFPVVHGFADGKEVTLLNAYTKRMRSYSFGSTEGPDEQTLSAQIALVGAHVYSSEEARFERADVVIEDLYTWSNSSAMKATIPLREDMKELGNPATITLSFPEDISAQLPEATITLTHHLILPNFDAMRGGSRGSAGHQPVLKIVPNQLASVSTLLDYVHRLQDLLALATGRGPGIIWLQLFEPRPYPDQELDGFNQPNQVNVYLLRRGNGDPNAKALAPWELVFSLEDIDFATVIPLWWKVNARFFAVCNMLLADRFTSGGFLEPELVTAVAAAEAFHAALQETPSVSREQNLKRLEPALAVLSEREQNWLKSLVPSGFSLRDRLSRLAERIPERCRMLLLPNHAAWSKATKAARNDLAHSGNSDIDPHTLLALVNVTKAVVLVNLLLELGLSEERLHRALTGNKELDRACRSSAKHFPGITSEDATA